MVPPKTRILLALWILAVTCASIPSVEGVTSCWACVDDCEDYEQISCTNTDDQCYMRFVAGENDVVDMGCTSTLGNEAAVTALIKTKELWLCNENNCNSFRNIPSPNDCISCDSSLDSRCATQPDVLKNVVKCNIIPYTECVEYVTNTTQGRTVRGCLNSLTDEHFYGCLTKTDSNCRTCTGTNCNNKVIPTERRKCHRCNSGNDPTCFDAPNSLQICPQYNADEGCVTRIDGDTVVRDCQSELSCTGYPGSKCNVCQSDGCNTVDLLGSNIGDPGDFQPIPLNCYHCDGAVECASETMGKINVCYDNKYQYCTTVISKSSGQAVARGCSDKMSEKCAESTNECYDCKSNACNSLQKEADLVECLYCDGRTNNDCALEPSTISRTRKCQKSCMTISLVRNKTDPRPVLETLRTCFDDLDPDDQEECEAGKDANCKPCTTAKCNTALLHTPRRSCYHCSGDSCSSPVAKQCSAWTEEDQCYIEYDGEISNKVIRMGCSSQIESYDLRKKISSRKLWECTTDNCNTVANLPAQQDCVLCSSLAVSDCAIAPEKVSGRVTCSEAPYRGCYTRLVEDGHTERGCESRLLDEEVFYGCVMGLNTTECATCVGSNCNNKIFPDDRKKCHVCDSHVDPTCVSAPNAAQYCLQYTPDDKCVTHIDGNGFTIRNCASSLKCDERDPQRCNICSGDSCNTVNLQRNSDAMPGMWQPLPLKCLDCKNEADCTASRTTIATCSDNEHCMTVFTTNGNAVERRGCSKEVESNSGAYCDANEGRCFNCNSNECNTATSVSQYGSCLSCDARTNSDCTFNPDKILGHRQCHGRCMTALHPRTNGSDVLVVVRSCANDKDVADQLECDKDTTGKNCISCSGANCNTQVIPSNRLSCNICSGDQCEDLVPEKCHSYKENDQCYMLFNRRNSVAQMGCISDLEEEYLDSVAHLLLTCDGDNCNTFSIIPTPKTCVKCNSEDDERCATSPRDIPTVEECTSLPHVECRMAVGSDGITERGCVSSVLRPVMMSCLSGNNTNCATCMGDKCNNVIFPENRRSCHRCDTRSDPSCGSSPAASSICPYYRENERCSSKYVSGHTYRGCAWDFTCDESDPLYCRMCDLDNCNVVDLAAVNIGYPGHWQPVPVNCYTCSGPDCVGVVKKCEGSKDQNCGIIFASNGTVVERGCSTTVYEKYGDFCDSNSNNCKFCKGNGCNTATNLSQYVDCLFCDAATDPKCALDPTAVTRLRSCDGKCIQARYPRTKESNPAYELERTCLVDMDIDDIEACEAGTHPNCKACSGTACNNELLPATPHLRCNYCTTSDCSKAESRICRAYRPHDQCYTQFSEGSKVIGLGCFSDKENSYSQQHKRRLSLCDGDNCNKLEFEAQSTACAICNSLQDPRCVTNPSLVVQAVCDDMPITSCYMDIDEAGVLRRGCLSDASDAVIDDCLSGNSTHCVVCDTNGCNTVAHPKNRHSCLRCNSQTDPDCHESASKHSEFCPIYRENEKCVTTLTGDARTLRGCASDFSCNPNSRETCRICENGDNCNTVNLLAASIGAPGQWQQLPINCNVCNGTTACANSGGRVQKCENNNQQTCLTVFNAAGEVQERGCSDQILAEYGDYCDEKTNNCIGCKSSGCNNANAKSDFRDCYFCDSAQTGAACSVSFESATARTRLCHGGCAVMTHSRSSTNPLTLELTRSCLDDMDLDDREACTAGKLDYCQSCTAARCNTAVLPSTPRLTCWTCIGDECESPTTRQCSAYHPNDQCYTVFDPWGSLIGLGCRSEYEDNMVAALQRQRQMLLCDGEKCNSPANIPQPQSCSVCDSKSDSRCATNPNLIGEYQRCSKLPYTGCVTRVDKNGITHRGCQEHLEQDVFYGCLIGTDGLCEFCNGNNCNEIDVYPADRPRCQQCDSISDPLCTAAPNNNKVCAVYSRNDVCVINLHDGITTRGCASDLKCDTPDDHYTCRSCRGSGCNIANLELSTPTNEPGLWQPVPLSCHQCSNVTHCAEDVGILRVCEGDKYQQCDTIFDENGAVSHRGCSGALSTTNRNYCSANPDKCMYCNSNGCNEATALSQYVDCIECDSRTGGSKCSVNGVGETTIRKCYKHCMTALYPLWKEWNPSYGTIRSCYDDKDLDERTACEAGTDSTCKICSSGKCNTETLPAKRLSCYICEGDECQRPTTQSCPNYRENDSCYIRYDETRAVVALGCRSEFSNDVANYLLSQKRLFLCDGENCNKFDNLPMSQLCVLCSSRTDGRCATRPTDVSTTTTCSKPPYTNCYERILSDGATERGCLDSLYDQEFVDCLNGTSPLCNTCLGSRCNGEIYPTNRLSCHICDSTENPNCEKKPNNLSICPLYDEDDMCVTSFSNGVTRRGCSSSIRCDSSNSRSCVQCNTPGCNTVNLVNKQDDNYGKWQDLPLTCRSCNGASDCAKSPDQLPSLECENNNEQDCVTVFSANGNQVLSRGCTDAVAIEHEEFCDDNDGTCFKCKSNNCNIATSPTQFIECLYCDTAKNSDCLLKPENITTKRHCRDSCMTALYPSVEGVYETTRTCLDDKEVADQTICSSGTDPHCAACNTADCNTVTIPSDRRSCYTCAGDDCESPKKALCQLYTKDDQCFIWFNQQNDIAEMGCLSSFRSHSVEAVLGTKRILVCNDGDNCNYFDKIAPAQKCVVCNSKDNKYCAINPHEVGSVATCNEQPYTGCYTQLRSDGSTWRDCLWNAPDDSYVACLTGTDANCTYCTGNACNREIFPADRQLCYTCNSLEDSSCESQPQRKLACPIVRNSEACVTALSGNVTVRGCSSDVFCDTTDPSTCQLCYESGCNSMSLINNFDDGFNGMWQTLPLRCHTCNGEHCEASLGPEQTCVGNIKQDCMTVFNGSGIVTRRGCSDSVLRDESTYCNENNDHCYHCKSNGCNDAWSRDNYISCITCDSQKDERCINSPTNSELGSRQCQDECMMAILDDGNRIIRSCLDDKEEFVRYECRGNIDGANCTSCNTNNCNKSPYPSDLLMCHECTDSSCTQTQESYCPNSADNDYCFAKYENGHITLLGCASSQDSTDLEEWRKQNILVTCKSSGCNDISRLPTGSVQCVKCDSSSNHACAQNPSAIVERISCNAPYTDCLTQISNVGNTVRGCANTISTTDQDKCVGNGTCSICAEATCNNAIFPADRLQCQTCKSASDKDDECIDEPKSVLPCLYYKSTDTCVSKKDDNGIVERGCGSDGLDCNILDEDNCKICNVSGCNDDDMSGANGLFNASLGLTALLAFIVTNLRLG